MKTALKLLAIATAYVAATVLMYRQRNLSGPGPWDSDFLIFYLPAAIPLYANSRAIKKALPVDWSQAKRRTVTWGVAVAAAFVATWVFAFIAFNAYGT